MEKRPINQTWLIAALLFSTLAHVFDFVIMMPIGPKLMTEFGITAATFGVIVSIYTVAAAGSSFISTVWMDRVDRRKSLLVLLVGFTFGNGLCMWAPSVEVLVIGRFVAGAFGGVIQAIVYSIISQEVSPDRQGRAAGIMGTSFPLVSIIGVPVGLRVADFFGWRMAFVLVFSISLVAFVLAIFAIPQVEPQKSESKPTLLGPLKAVWSYRPHHFALLLVFFTVMGGFTIVPYIAPFLIFNGYILEGELYLVYLVGGGFSIFTSRIIGGYCDKVGKIKMLRIMVVATIVVLLIFTNMPKVSLIGVLVISTMTMVAIPGRFVCVMSWMTTIVNPATRGSYMALMSTVQQITIGVASLLGGFLVGEAADGSLATYWLVGIVAVGFNVAVLVITPVLARIETDVARR